MEYGFFFIPEILISLKQQELTIECSSLFPEAILAEIHASPAVIEKPVQEPIKLKHGITAETYKEKILALKRHILRGDCYEINFCQSFYANDTSIDPLFVYQQLAALSPNPFGAFYRLNDKYCLCASPERFIKKTSNTIISQPIKGTAKRNLENEEQDIAARNYLLNSEKEKSENVMIVDLVRNDLSKVCTEGSVRVTELFGVYPFPQVHQLISTIEGNVNEDTPFTAILEACFPMGSMTGAPKKRVMELIEQYEQIPRGLFSGSIGYITPSADFDFNVVIRSLMLDASQKLISFKAGGGITFNSDPEQEYEECLLKAKAMFETYAAAGADAGLVITGEFTGGCADSGFTAGVGCPTLCAVGPVGANAHTVEEYLEVGSIVPRAQALALAIMRLPSVA